MDRKPNAITSSRKKSAVSQGSRQLQLYVTPSARSGPSDPHLQGPSSSNGSQTAAPDVLSTYGLGANTATPNRDTSPPARHYPTSPQSQPQDLPSFRPRSQPPPRSYQSPQHISPSQQADGSTSYPPPPSPQLFAFPQPNLPQGSTRPPSHTRGHVSQHPLRVPSAVQSTASGQGNFGYYNEVSGLTSSPYATHALPTPPATSSNPGLLPVYSSDRHSTECYQAPSMFLPSNHNPNQVVAYNPPLPIHHGQAAVPEAMDASQAAYSPRTDFTMDSELTDLTPHINEMEVATDAASSPPALERREGKKPKKVLRTDQHRINEKNCRIGVRQAAVELDRELNAGLAASQLGVTKKRWGYRELFIGALQRIRGDRARIGILTQQLAEANAALQAEQLRQTAQGHWILY